MCLLDSESQKTVAGVGAQTEWGPGNRSFSADRVRIKVGLKLVTRGKGAGDASFLFKVLVSKNIRENTLVRNNQHPDTGWGTDGSQAGPSKTPGLKVQSRVQSTVSLTGYQ